MTNNFSKFLHNLEEFRKIIIYILIILFLLSVPPYLLFPKILKIIAKPAGKLYFFSPYEALVSKIFFSIFGGFLLSIPIDTILFWNFVKKGLYENERKIFSKIIIFSVFSFYAGFFFAFFIIFPNIVSFLLSYKTDCLTPILSLKNYLSFLLSFCFIFGLISQLPFILIFLCAKGLINPENMKKPKKQIILIIFIFSAVITPPDVVSQFSIALPLIAAFEITLFVSKILYKKRKRP